MASGDTGRGKSKVVAGVLSVLLGSLGIHHFYLGSIGSGVICILLNCTLIGGSLIGLVEGIMLFAMSDENFDARYNARTPESIEFVFMQPK